MKLTKQLNEKECAICVINSFIDHYYGYSDKNKLLTEANMSENGINISEFERLCIDHKLIPSSYEIDFDEFKSLDTKNQWFCLLITTNSTNHYVIAKKQNDKVLIYDSYCGIYEWTYMELQKHFLNIYIKIEKQNISLIKIEKKHNLFNIKPIVLLINIVSQLLIGGIGILCGMFLNFLLGLCSTNLEIKTLVLVCTIFALIDVLRAISNYLYFKYITHIIYLQYKILKHQIIYKIMNKKDSIKNKIDVNYFYMLNEIIYEVIKFNINEYATLIADTLICLISFCISLIYSWYFIFIFIFVIAIELIFLLFNISKQQSLIGEKIKSTNNLNNMNTIYIKNINCNYNCYLYNTLFLKLQKCYLDSTFNDYKIQQFNNTLNTIKSCILNFIEIVVSFIGMILINKTKGFSIGNMLFITSTIKIFMDDFNNVVGFKLKYDAYLKFYDIYDLIFNVDNIENKNKKIITKVKKLKIKINEQQYEIKDQYELDLPIKKFVGYLTNRRDDPNINIFINDINVKEINQNWINNTICYFDENIRVKIAELNQTIVTDYPEILSYLKEINSKYILNELDNNKISNLLYLITQKQKLIILNHYYDYFNENLVEFINKTIIAKIKLHNYLLIA